MEPLNNQPVASKMSCKTRSLFCLNGWVQSCISPRLVTITKLNYPVYPKSHMSRFCSTISKLPLNNDISNNIGQLVSMKLTVSMKKYFLHPLKQLSLSLSLSLSLCIYIYIYIFPLFIMTNLCPQITQTLNAIAKILSLYHFLSLSLSLSIYIYIYIYI